MKYNEINETKANEILRLCYFYFLSNKRSDKRDKKIEKEIVNIIARSDRKVNNESAN